VWFKSVTADYPIRLSFDFDNPLNDAYLKVIGAEAEGMVDIVRDTYVARPTGSSKDKGQTLRASAAGTLRRWSEAATLVERPLYGYDEVFVRFEQSLFAKPAALDMMGPEDALAMLALQHEIIRRAETNMGAGAAIGNQLRAYPDGAPFKIQVVP
jgi:hypothetical protein